MGAAQTTGSTRFGVYADDDDTLVLTPMVGATATPALGATVSVHYLADIVTSSSVDLVSAATASFTERRDDLSVSAGYTTLSQLSVGVGYDWSHETDYLSHTVSLTLGDEFLDRNLQLGLAWASSFNTVGRSGDPTFAESMVNHSATLTGAQVLSRGTVLKLTYQGQRAEGFQSSVYRYVAIGGAGFGGYRTAEIVPEVRWRHAAALALNQHLVGDLYANLGYRLYRDTWGVTAHTAELRLGWEATRTVDVWLRERVHAQGGASFYRSRYDALQTFMSSDKELGALLSSTTGLQVDFRWQGVGQSLGVSAFGLDLKVDYLDIRYDDFLPLDGLTAWMAEIGTSLTF